MSNCNEDLYDYDLVKKCSKCESVLLKSNFHRHKNMKKGLHPHCISCKKQYYIENCDRLNNYQKKHNYENKEKRNLR